MRRSFLALLFAGSLAVPLAAQQPVVYRIPVTGTIENGLAPFVARSLGAAARSGAAAAILDIDTPGGRVDAAQRIADAVRAVKMPVYAYVNPRAYSAGALVALSARQIYIRPGGVIGAATPVDGSGQKAPEKIVSAMRGEFRALAEARGIDPRLAEGMVDETIDIPGIKPAGKLLTLSAGEAVRLGVAAAEVPDVQAVLAATNLAGARLVTLEATWAEQVVRFLTNPLVSPLLLSLGVLGLVFEIKTGAFGLGGVLSVVSLGLFFGSNLILGLAGWEEVLLLALGLLALGFEVFVLPGFGVAGMAGIALVAGSMVLAMLSGAPTMGDIIQALAVLAAAAVVTVAVIVAWFRHLPHSGRFKGLFLREATESSQGFISAPPRTDLLGREGVALTDLRPSGTAEVGGERLDVVTEGEYLDAGSRVRVVRADGYRHVVHAA